MHKNFFLFEQLLKEIKPRLLGVRITETFTFQKDELVLGMNNDLFLHLSVSFDHPYFLISSFRRIKQPALSLFPEINGQTILNARLKPFDKHLIIELDAYRLEAVFYAKFLNVFLFDRTHRLISKFKDKNDYPFSQKASTDKLLLSNLQTQAVAEILERSGEQTLFTFFKKNFIALSNLLLNELFFRMQLPKEKPIHLLTKDERAILVQKIAAFGHELTDGTAYLYFKENQVEKISLLRLFHLEARQSITFKAYDSINAALSVFVAEQKFKQEFTKLKDVCSKALSARLKYLKNSLEKLKKNANLNERKTAAELKGNLLLTFKSTIPRGAKEVELENIFSDDREKVIIKLNPAKSVVANAEKYFSKFKQLNEKKRLHEIKRHTYEKELTEIEQFETELEKIKELSRLRKFAQKLKEIKLLQKTPHENEQKIAAHHLKYSFNRLILDRSWDVYIGKNGENNNLLTFRFANKWDIWLHAQGVSGSHVIIRVPKQDQMPPKHVIEQAAQIAAAHSKAKHSSTVPVMYTQVRYVSRVRKALPGTVKVQNEKVIFVKPVEIK